MNFITKTAARFRLIMSLLLVVLVVIAVAVAFFGLQKLDSHAKEVSKVVYEANSSEQKLNSIRSLRSEMASNPDAVKRAEQIVAESQSYSYQNLIVKDIQSMANRAGVQITNYTFSDPAGDSASGAEASAPEAAAPAPDMAADPVLGGPGADAAAPVAQSTLKSISFNITLQTPVNYKSLLKFIHSIEQNATKMQIATLTLSKGDSSSTVGIDALTIEVYIR